MLEPTRCELEIKIGYTIDGVVGSDEVRGAIYGQTESSLRGRLGHDLNSLQREELVGMVMIQNLQWDEDAGETKGVASIIAYDKDVAVWIVDTVPKISRVGPLTCKFSVSGVTDKRKEFDEIKKKVTEEFKF